jgi:hypothetical protein
MVNTFNGFKRLLVKAVDSQKPPPTDPASR